MTSHIATTNTRRRAKPTTARLAPRRTVVSHQLPGMEFAEGFPIGNGRIGVMCFGGPARLVFVINHFDLYWRPRATPKLREGFWAQVREAFRSQKWQELHDLTANAFADWGRAELGSFQPAGILEIWPELSDGATDYLRELDCDARVARMSCRIGRARFSLTAQTIADQPAATIMLRTSMPGGVRARVRLYRPGDSRFEQPVTECRLDGLRLRHCWDPDDTRYEVAVCLRRGRMEEASLSSEMFSPIVLGGHVPTVNHPDASEHAEALGIATAPEGVLELRVAVDVQRGQDARPDAIAVGSRVNGAGRDPHAVRALTRADIQLNGQNADDPDDPAHFEKLFHIGRYLFTSATTPDGWPPNLQGIWNDRTHPVCNSDYHLDLNTQMSLWHLPAGNLLEYHEPFFRLIERMLPGARENARCVFNMRGAAFPVCTVGDGEGLSYLDCWVGTSGWILNHFQSHWRYTLDRRFLRERYFPILREVCRFYLDYLQEDPDGRLVIYPSQSPENRLPSRNNSFHGKNSTFDLSIFRDVLSHTIEAAAVLGSRDDDVAMEAQCRLPKLAAFSVSKDGRLREMEDYEFTRAHRHFSHLYPVFPSDQITEFDPHGHRSASLALRDFLRWPATGQAEWFARVGYGARAGWTYPVLACTFARLGDGERALEALQHFSRAFRWPSGLARCFEEHDLGYGIHASPDIGRWIEIDSSVTIVAAIQEMLMQSHGGVIRLLPAFPKSWRRGGAFRGLRAQGGFEVDAEWSNGRLRRAVISSLLGTMCSLKSSNSSPLRVRHRGRDVEQTWDARRRVATFATRPGGRYEVTSR